MNRRDFVTLAVTALMSGPALAQARSTCSTDAFGMSGAATRLAIARPARSISSAMSASATLKDSSPGTIDGYGLAAEQ
jgi:hypothetical protein